MTEAIIRQEQISNQLHHTYGMARCPKCNGMNGQWRGYRTRKDGSVLHRRWCKQCGKWFIGAIHTRHSGNIIEEEVRESTAGPLDTGYREGRNGTVPGISTAGGVR